MIILGWDPSPSLKLPQPWIADFSVVRARNAMNPFEYQRPSGDSPAIRQLPSESIHLLLVSTGMKHKNRFVIAHSRDLP